MLEHINASIFLYINQSAGVNATFDQFMAIFADKLPIVFALVLLWLWFSNKGDDISLRGERRQAAFMAGYVMLLGLTINQLISFFYFHNRPYMDHLGTAIIAHVPENSFPSDHTTLMVSVSIGLMLSNVTRTLGALLLPLGIAGGFARVYCGIHYPFDIIGSIAVSCLAAGILFPFNVSIKRLNDRLFSVYDNLIVRYFPQRK